jgi:integrase
VEALKAEEGEPTTFGEFAEQWLSSNLDDFRNAKHRQQWRSTLEAYAKPLNDKPIEAIETAHVLEVLQPIWNTKRETARRVRGRIERILDAAKAKGLRTGENPARWRGHLKAILPDQKKPVQHHAAMPFETLPAFIAQLRERDALSARALEFLILTGTRSTEGRGALWSEIDLDAGVWTIPGERMKANKAHRVPLSDAALAVLEPLHELKSDDGVFVFPKMGGEGFVSEAALRNLMGRMGAGEWTIHGFRSTLRDWAGEATSFPRDVAEMALAHKVGDEVERAYRRGDALEKRRALMQAWADYCGGGRAGRVVHLRAK